MPMRNLLAIVTAVGIGVYAFFGVIERLNKLETSGTLLEKDLEQVTKTLSGDIEKNNEFRIKWPRGELGSLPADSEQFMLIEHMAGQIEKIQIAIEEGMHNKVNIEFLQNQLEKLQEPNRMELCTYGETAEEWLKCFIPKEFIKYGKINSSFS